jgi:hypothetical protein
LDVAFIRCLSDSTALAAKDAIHRRSSTRIPSGFLFAANTSRILSPTAFLCGNEREGGRQR